MIIEVSKEIAQGARCGPEDQTWVKLSEIMHQVNDNFKLKEIDEETRRAMIRSTVEEGSPGNGKISCSG